MCEGIIHLLDTCFEIVLNIEVYDSVYSAHIKILKYLSKNNELLGFILSYNKKKIHIFGYEKMEEILKNINLHNAQIIKKVVKINTSNPLFIVIAMAIPVIIILIISFVDFRIHSIFNFIKILFYFWGGLIIIITKPFTKSRGIKYSKFEIIMGLLLIIISFVEFYSKFIESSL